ncbi:hypothetical protein CKN82_10060 [Carnobacterium divergens]|uniref:helix-turn-helix domain-containing protein n=1 Tax=Carnobacterium divergens TaxID=2748 RepID=UPI0010728EEB|nr:helix-turn-helix domain-containing protein [Carnobacterium divergens]MDT1996354.1 helix-turn-helix domain-containing protein [Carnobacterium divergens]TFI67142.1 hypothetical protein CKN70_10215 [Carnobacterium divergens]TFI79175.1 hypothetical protein CKN68_10175 [Carnobacterium divergens]TFI86647.1 hypothetical protein CKN72_09940 [Carnobacterium divergens]TFI87529.1 hypothetical protein CKN61_10450 [Carnobacterium divergens]
MNQLESSLYLEYLFLSLFSRKEARKPISVFHILTGKRTASILYVAESYQLKHFFSCFRHLKKEEYLKKMDILIERNELKTTSDSLVYLTEKGEKAVANFFENHYYPTHFNGLLEGRSLKSFWRLLTFVTQVLSEMSHENVRYLPIEKEWKQQIWLKSWLQMQKKMLSKEMLSQSFAKEWMALLAMIEPIGATVISLKLTGYKTYGKTAKQISILLERELDEIQVILTDGLFQCIKYIKESNEFPLFLELYLESIRKISLFNQSTLETKKLIDEGSSLDEVATKRGLKLSTVSEHLIELAILDETYPIKELIPERDYRQIMGLFELNPTIGYYEIEEQGYQILFYIYRLLQIERRRTNG